LGFDFLVFNMVKKFKIIIILFLSALFIFSVVYAVLLKNKDLDNAGEIAIPNNSLPVAPESSFYKTFSHPIYGFSFDYPPDWSVDAFSGEDEETLLLRSAEKGIMIFVYPFNETGVLTKERILRDVPDMKIENEISLKIAGAVDALGFDSKEREFGPTKEIWFIHNGRLYQVAAGEGTGEVLYNLVETWRFN
jgi:hypothetical protein